MDGYTMKLHEYEAKEILSEHQIPIPHGALVFSSSESKDAASQLRFPLVVKAQVLVSGRGKAGGIKFVNKPEDLREVTAEVLDMKIKGLEVDCV